METREKIIDGICVLFILLFVYASASKFLEYDLFVIQLTKSPMLVNLSGFIAWFIPGIEIVISIFLVFHQTRSLGLYGSLLLMGLFTFYIVAILGYSDYVPCSCGGVLQKLSWTNHLVFNVAFCLLAIVGIYLQSFRKTKSLLVSGGLIITSIAVVAILFSFTYQQSEKYSSFVISELKNQPVSKDSIDLLVNSYYFAGTCEDTVYLGNETVPGLLTGFNPASGELVAKRIHSEETISANSRIKVNNYRFFLYDGNIPAIVAGNVSDLAGRKSSITYPAFNDFVPISSTRYALRLYNSDNEFILAVTSPDSGLLPKPGILRKQIDGRFDIDGVFLFNADLGKLAYVHIYTNRFIILDTLLNNPFFRRTIDSVRTAKITVTTVERRERTSNILIPSLVVNRHAFCQGDFLFIESGIRAKNETVDKFETHVRLDVYEFIRGNYLGSFSLSIDETHKPREYLIFNKDLYVLVDNYLTRYDVSGLLAECRQLSQQRNFTGQ